MSLPEILRGRLSVPVIASPMFIVSNPELVIAQCTSGVVGSFPSLNARPAEKLEEWLQQIRRRWRHGMRRIQSGRRHPSR